MVVFSSKLVDVPVKGMTHDQIKHDYYTAYGRNTLFSLRGSEKEAEWIKSHEEHMKACRERVKRQKVEKEKGQARVETKIILIEDDFYPDPLQVRHPIVDWKIHTEDDLASTTWKITRMGGETSSFITFVELVKECD